MGGHRGGEFSEIIFFNPKRVDGIGSRNPQSVRFKSNQIYGGEPAIEFGLSDLLGEVTADAVPES